jgi:hypothetical protein
MTALQTIEEKGNDGVRKLRLQKLAKGHPFMINSRDLPENQCYLEYPNGDIKLVSLKKEGKEFVIIQLLSPAEAQALRKRYHFPTL